MTQWGRVLGRSDPGALVARRGEPGREFAHREVKRATEGLNE
jgi:hypothetical protein